MDNEIATPTEIYLTSKKQDWIFRRKKKTETNSAKQNTEASRSDASQNVESSLLLQPQY